MNRFLIPDDFVEQGDCKLRELVEYTVPVSAMRVHDAMGTPIGTAGNDDLGVISGTIGTTGVYVTSGDLHAAGATTRYARFTFVLPPEYAAEETVKVRLYCDMVAAADTSATADVQCYKQSKSAGTVGTDLCTTSATSINSTTAAAVDFTITATSLVAGDVLDVRVAIAVTDAAGGGDVSAYIYQTAMLLDIRG